LRLPQAGCLAMAPTRHNGNLHWDSSDIG